MQEQSAPEFTSPYKDTMQSEPRRVYPRDALVGVLNSLRPDEGIVLDSKSWTDVVDHITAGNLVGFEPETDRKVFEAGKFGEYRGHDVYCDAHWHPMNKIILNEEIRVVWSPKG